ncbi:glycosyltransferase family 87 protein [Rhodococcus rhodochrous]|uniref:glycosyltransferase family 87 protein n=1 Tax=Rhodococcus rhodochrous TaxID=1829 RepID=UPI00030CDE38|nr:glycosyltransferase family 87 protein [Rhodococcus rhodochrous]
MTDLPVSGSPRTRWWAQATARSPQALLQCVFWPVAVMLVVHRTVILAVDGHRTDDFTGVYRAAVAFWNRQPVYTAAYHHVDPHYLYPPSGSLLIAPFAVFEHELSRWVFIGANALAVLLAVYLVVRMFGHTAASAALPIAVTVAFVSESVVNTLVFTNINGVILLGQVAFLTLLLARRDLWAGAAIGLTFAIKPILAPLLLLPVLRRQLKVFITAAGVPIVLTALAWPWAADPWQFVERTVPYLLQSRDYFNSSITGNGTYYGLPEPLILILRIGFALLTATTIYLLYRYHRHDEVFFVVTSAGVLMTASFLLGSLGQMYYSMLLFPLLMSVVLPQSVMRNWPAWLAVYGFLSADQWYSGRWVEAGRYIEYMRPTWGWSLLLVVIFAVLLDRRIRPSRPPAEQDGRNTGHRSASSVPHRL